MQPKILMAVSPRQRGEIFSTDSLRRLEGIGAVTYQGEGSLSEEELGTRIRDVQALITCWGSPRVVPQILERAGELKLISHSAGSIRSYVCPEAFDSGITVTNASSAIAVSVAESTLGMILASLRRICQHSDSVRRPRGQRRDLGPMYELGGRRVGIVGMGEVGRRVMGLLRPFSCEVLVHDPYKTASEIADAGGRPCSLEELMASCSVVSLHAPNIPRNRRMVTREMLESMQTGALLVNTARGELLDEDALIELALAGRVRIALDVLEGDTAAVVERLAGVPDAILTPHVAGQSIEARWRQGDAVVEDVELFFQGKRPRNLVTREMLDWMA